MPETPREVLIRYLEDVIAAEHNFEDQLSSLADRGDQPYVKELLREGSMGARRQREMLTARLHALGGTPSRAKSILAHFLAYPPAAAQAGQEEYEKNTQHLIMGMAAAAAEMAMYEALATVASEAGDAETEHLARQMQEHERADHERVWSLLRKSALDAVQAAIGSRTRGAA